MADAARQADLRRYAYLYNGPASRPFRRGIGLQNRLTDLKPDTDGETGPTNDAPQVPVDAPPNADEAHNNAMGTQTGAPEMRDASTAVYPRRRNRGTQADDVRIDYLRGINHRFEEEEARAERAERRAPTRDTSVGGDFPMHGNNDHEAGGSGAHEHEGGEHVTHLGDNYFALVNVHVQIRDAQVENAENYLAAAIGYNRAQTRALDVPLPDDDDIDEAGPPRPVPQYPQVFASAGPAGPRRLQFTRNYRGVQSVSALPRSHPMRLRSHNVHRHAARQRLLDASRTVQSGISVGRFRRPNGVPGTRIGHAAPAA